MRSSERILLGLMGGAGAPANTAAPALPSTLTVGVAATITPGMWVGTAPITFTYDILDASNNVLHANVGVSWTPITADAGLTVHVRENATNGVGSASANSTAVFVTFSLVWALEFATPASPLPNPYTDGAYSVVVTDTASRLSAAAGVMSTSGSGTAAGFVSSISLARVAGRTLRSKAILAIGDAGAGWDQTNTLRASYSNMKLSFKRTTAGNVLGLNGVPITLVVSSVPTEQAIVQLAVGALFFIKVSGVWLYSFGFSFGSDTPLWIQDAQTGTATAEALEYLRVADLPAPLTSVAGIASVNQASPVSGTNYAGSLAGEQTVEFALPGSPSANLVAVELRFRVLDANNYWTAYIRRNAGNTAWDYHLDIVIGGVASPQITATGVGAPIQMRVAADGDLVDGYVLTNAAGWSKRGAQVNDNHFNTQTAINATFDGSTTVTSLVSIPKRAAIYDQLLNAIGT